MGDDAIVAYKNAPSIDVELELEALGAAFAENSLLFCQSIVRGRGAGGIDHWNLLPFEEYRGVPIYKYSYNGRFSLIAVEDVADGERLVSLIMAGRTGRTVSIDGESWDGVDMSTLRDPLLRRRLEDYFT